MELERKDNKLLISHSFHYCGAAPDASVFPVKWLDRSSQHKELSSGAKWRHPWITEQILTKRDEAVTFKAN